MIPFISPSPINLYCLPGSSPPLFYLSIFPQCVAFEETLYGPQHQRSTPWRHLGSPWLPPMGATLAQHHGFNPTTFRRATRAIVGGEWSLSSLSPWPERSFLFGMEDLICTRSSWEGQERWSPGLVYCLLGGVDGARTHNASSCIDLTWSPPIRMMWHTCCLHSHLLLASNILGYCNSCE